jgi:hypothetical protein
MLFRPFRLDGNALRDKCPWLHCLNRAPHIKLHILCNVQFNDEVNAPVRVHRVQFSMSIISGRYVLT